MRENRTYGSEGGETGKPVFPTPIGWHGHARRIEAARAHHVLLTR